MCILRRVSEAYRALNPPPDDNYGYLKSVMDKLTPAERQEWNRQYDIVESMQPQCGSYEAALAAFEAANPDAL